MELLVAVYVGFFYLCFIVLCSMLNFSYANRTKYGILKGFVCVFIFSAVWFITLPVIEYKGYKNGNFQQSRSKCSR